MKEELKQKGMNLDALDGIKIVPYIYELQEIMSASEILVCRAGATTITEIANLGRASILIPLPNVSHNHQMYNAEVLEKVGAAKIIKNDELNASILNEEIGKILEKDTLKKMGENARRIAISDSQDKIYREIKKLVK